MALIKRRNSLVELLAIPEDADEQSRRINGKVDRALERTRRAAIAMLDSSTSKNPDDGCESVQALLGTLVDAFEASLWQVGLVVSTCLFYILTLLTVAETQRRSSHSMLRHLIRPRTDSTQPHRPTDLCSRARLPDASNFASENPRARHSQLHSICLWGVL